MRELQQSVGAPRALLELLSGQLPACEQLQGEQLQAACQSVLLRQLRQRSRQGAGGPALAPCPQVAALGCPGGVPRGGAAETGPSSALAAQGSA